MRASRRCVVEPLEIRALLSAGDPDLAFGSGGVALAPLGGMGRADIATAPGGRLVVVASTVSRYDDYLSLARLRADGSLDPSFGASEAGITRVPQIIPPDDAGVFTGQSATALAVQADGKVLIAGSAFDEGDQVEGDRLLTRRVGFLMRFRADGSPDPSFGGGDGIVTGPEGIVTVVDGGPPNAGASPFVGVALVAGGKVVSAREGVLFRFNPDGTPDTSFGGDGQVALQLPPLEAPGPLNPAALALAPDGSGDVVVLGTLVTFEGNVVVVARVRPDGTPATSFGDGDGVAVQPFRGGLFPGMAAHMAVQPDGAVVLAGYYRDSQRQWFALSRLGRDGELDDSFGRGGPDGDGVVSAGIPGGTERSANDVAVLPDGRIVATGNAGSLFNVVRFTPAGLVDPTFAPGGRDGDGVATVDFPPDVPSDNPDVWHTHVAAHALAVQTDGKVVGAAGDLTSDGWGAGGNVILARLLADPPPPGARTYEAEQATMSGAVVSATHPGFTGAGYVDYAHASGDWVEFTVQAPAAGAYQLAFRYANGGATARPMELRVSGQTSPLRVDFMPTGSWRTWNSESSKYPVALAAGANKVRLLATGQSGPNLDALTVTPSAPAGTVYQAESARLSGATAAATQGGYTGTGYADYVHASGDFVEFTVDAPAAGTYALAFRYANGGTAERPLDLSIDGQVLTGRLSFAPTGTWRTWGSVTRSVLLTAGQHTVRLTATGRSGPNLDALTVRPGQ